MNMSETILNQQLEDMQKRFHSLADDDLEGKVSNIKQRIFLMQKKLGENKKEDTVKIVSTPQPQNDTRAEMNDLRKKLMPKQNTKLPKQLPIEDELEQSDRELQDAIERALAKVK